MFRWSPWWWTSSIMHSQHFQCLWSTLKISLQLRQNTLEISLQHPWNTFKIIEIISKNTQNEYLNLPWNIMKHHSSTSLEVPWNTLETPLKLNWTTFETSLKTSLNFYEILLRTPQNTHLPCDTLQTFMKQQFPWKFLKTPLKHPWNIFAPSVKLFWSSIETPFKH